MKSNQEYLCSKETIESIIRNPEESWRGLFKEIVISMIASNQNEMLWYANFLTRCEYEFHFNESFASSIYFNGKNFVIVINPSILGLLAKEQVIAILKHNAGHIIQHHFKRLVNDETIDQEFIDIAKDIVINGSQEHPYIKELTETSIDRKQYIQALFYEDLTKKYNILDYEIGREFEYYAQLIKDSQEKESSLDDRDEENQSCEINIQNESSNGEGDELSKDISNQDNNGINPASLSEKTLESLENGTCNIDNHDYGEKLQETVGLNGDLLESFIDTILNEMIDDATSFARGFVPEDAIDTKNRIERRKSHKDWKKVFNKKMKNFLSNSMRYREVNKSRQHPIYTDDLDLYGYSRSKKPKLAVVLDVSGSVDNKLLSAMISEVRSIQKKYSINSITLVQVDAEVKSVEKFTIHDKFIIRGGSGGTVMEPAFDILMKQANRYIPDIIICATDGDIEEKFKSIKIPNKIQVIWLVEEKGKLLFDTSSYPKQQMQVINFTL